MRDLSFIRNSREREFAAVFFDHDEWEHQPGPYHLSVGGTYTPDFKDLRRGCLIEVVGSRQAHSFNRCKYEFFKKESPMPLELRTPDGELYEPNKSGAKKLYSVGCERFDSRLFPGRLPTADQMRCEVAAIASLPGWSINRVSDESGVSKDNVYRFVKGMICLSWPSLEKLWPFLYGDKRPLPTQPQDGAA